MLNKPLSESESESEKWVNWEESYVLREIIIQLEIQRKPEHVLSHEVKYSVKM